MNDEIWTTKDGTEIPVGDMTEGHAKNALRMLLRQRRKLHEKRLELVAKQENMPPEAIECCDEGFYERPDNHTVLAELRAKHGDAVRVERAGVAGMDGGNVFIGGAKYGWLGGI